MRKCLLASAVALVFIFSVTWAARAADDQTLAEKLLEVMRANHQITEAQYKELKKEAEKEKAAMAAQAQVAKAPAAKPAPNALQATWNNGLRLTSEDKAFDVHIGGRIQLDVADAEANDALNVWANKQLSPGLNGPKVDGFGDQVRRARLAIDGTLWKDIEFISQIEFAPTYTTSTVLSSSAKFTAFGSKASAEYFRNLTTGYAVSFQDLWVGVKDIPYLGRFKVGQMYEPISIEQMTSDNWNTFMEKALPMNALVPTRNLGFEVQNTICDDRLGWMVGYFFAQQVSTPYNGVAVDGTADLFSPHLEDTDAAVRVTGLPWYEDNGAKLLHIGIGYEHKFRSDSTSTTNPGWLDLKTYPEGYMFSPMVDTGYFTAKGMNVIDPEIALVYGPFSVQAEYTWAFANNVMPAFTNGNTGLPAAGVTKDNASFSGWYAYASYFLTGEHRPYNKTPSTSDYQATFGRVIPNCNFNPSSGGFGAWEVAFRVSNVDLNDTAAGFNGGNETDYTAGINWYLNPNVMLKLNYVYATVGTHAAATLAKDGSPLFPMGHENIVESRFQIAF